jgi:adenosylcobinamide-GDP ribazoletransferase
MAALPYVSGDAARSRPVARGGPVQAVVATLVAAVALALAQRALSLVAVLAMVAVSMAAAMVCGWRFHVRAGGITGDFLGATQQVCECALLLALALV